MLHPWSGNILLDIIKKAVLLSDNEGVSAHFVRRFGDLAT